MGRFKTLLELVRFEHTIFALPFAFSGMILAQGGWPPWGKVFWILLAMVGARTAAMGLNRIIDAKIDARNPRTRNWSIPSGRVSVAQAWLIVVISCALLILSAGMLNRLALELAPVAIVLLFIYPYTKRIGWWSHFFLGLCQSMAPVGAWIGIRGTLDPEILVLGAAVVFWLAGFDTLYAIQDMEFDRKEGLHSIPQKWGIKASLMLSKSFHAVMFLLLALLPLVFRLKTWFIIGLIVMAGLLIYEHSLVKENDLSRLNIAFFNMNGWISVTFFAFVFIEVVL